MHKRFPRDTDTVHRAKTVMHIQRKDDYKNRKQKAIHI